MTDIDIEYCEPCGLREPAMAAQAALLDAFGQDLEGVRLQPAHGGVFRVHAAGDLVWDRDDHGGEVDPDAIVDAVRERAAVGSGV